jgi:hypothetical protein
MKAGKTSLNENENQGMGQGMEKKVRIIPGNQFE